MSEQDWTEWFAKSFMMFLNGDALRARDERGRTVRDDSFLLLFNSHVDTVTFTLPSAPWGEQWAPVLATEDGFAADSSPMTGGVHVERPGLSLMVFGRIHAGAA